MNRKMGKAKSKALAVARESKRNLLRAAELSEAELLGLYDTTLDGYGEEMVEEMREQYGENKMTKIKGDGIFKQLFSSFINPFTIVLIVLAVISFITDFMLAVPGSKDLTAVIIVAIMVFISGIMRFIQESRSNSSAEKLNEMVETTILVKRSGEAPKEIPIDELVVGDIVYLAAGDMVPADVRIIRAKDLFVSQSSLTGESEPVEKFAESPDNGKNPLECVNLAFMGSNVVSGTAAAVVVNIGDYTIFGSIARDISRKKVETSFDRGVSSVSWLLIRLMLIMAPVVLLVNGFTKGNWMEALLFALSVAIGLTPEMLPMIISTNLAKGAVAMSKKKVIVKDLNSIQNFGAIDVLCTDKTGTLTQDRVILEYSLDVHGNEDERVLRHAFLNSYHQTGLRNLMDNAIIQHANEKEMVHLWQDYHKVDEIPFDFNRRRMSVVVADSAGKTQLITKGAIEEMLLVCSYVEYDGNVVPITDELKESIRATVNEYNDDGMRVLGIAQKTNPSPAGAFSVADESDMVLMGYLAFLDPPKESAAKAVSALLEHGVAVKILTGDNDAVAKCICRQVGIKIDNVLLGSDIEEMDNDELAVHVESTTVFAKLSPQQKSRIVGILRRNGHTVGFMGDGINDAAAMKEADVGISVDTAVDIAKESANIILLEKDLMALENGVIEGRKTYTNIIKYLKLTASSNFGNIFAVLAASIFLPFLPMLPLQLLILNLIYDIICIAMPWDNVDESYLKKPRDWDASSIRSFMFRIGPASTIFDITTFTLLFLVICPQLCGGHYAALDAAGQAKFVALFQAGWFVESLWTQTMAIHMMRSPKLPFIHSRASWQVTVLSVLGVVVGTIIPYTPLGTALDMMPLPLGYYPFLIATILLYMAVLTAVKKLFVRKFGELL